MVPVPPLTIGDIEILLVSLPMLRPHRSAGGTVDTRTVALVRLSAEGHDGWGEAAPVPAYSPETASEVWEALVAAGESVAGTTIDHPADLTGGALAALPPTARHALESAAWDLAGRVSGRSTAALLGGEPGPISVVPVLGTIDDPDVVAERALGLLTAGHTQVKVKVSGLADLPALAALADRLPPGTLRADANGSLPPDRADAVAIRVATMHLDFLEQPFPADAVDASAAVAAEVAVCLDETITDADAARAALRAGAGTIASVKPGRLGGLTAALDVLTAVADSGADALIGGLLESGVGRAASLALAAAVPGTRPAELAPPTYYLAHDLVVGPLRVRAGAVTVPDEPGLGFAVDEDALDRVTDARHVARA